MKLAIIGSRNLNCKNIGDYLPLGITEIVSGGARGIDSDAAAYARKNKIKLTEFLPKYNLYGRTAPLKRNEEIAKYADEAIAFWDGYSRGTKYTIDLFQKLGKKVKATPHNSDGAVAPSEISSNKPNRSRQQWICCQ